MTRLITLVPLLCFLLGAPSLAQSDDVPVDMHVKTVLDLIRQRDVRSPSVTYVFKRGPGHLKSSLATALLAQGYYVTPPRDIYVGTDLWNGCKGADIIEECNYAETQMEVFTQPNPGLLWTSVARLRLFVDSMIPEHPDQYNRRI
jgi:hypothetical protein